MSQTMKKRAEKREREYNQFLNTLKHNTLIDIVNMYVEAKTNGKIVHAEIILPIDEILLLQDIDEKINGFSPIDLTNIDELLLLQDIDEKINDFLQP